MSKRFTWERGPFQQCPGCQKNTLGILSAGGEIVTLRCTDCRYSYSEMLPAVEKRVIYLDQFVFSLLFKVKAGGKLPQGHEDFSVELYKRLRRVVLLQQAILPHSDIHHNETTVYHSANDLRAAYEWFGGDARLIDVRDVEQKQIAAYAKAYLEAREPTLSFDVRTVLSTRPNVWLDDMHVHVNVDYGIFADGIRKNREQTHAGMQRLVKTWTANRPSFDELLANELHSFFEGRRQGLAAALRNLEVATASGDPMAILEATHHTVFLEQEMVSELFRRAGVADNRVGREVARFWRWDRNIDLPHHRISAYMFAAIGRRIVNGQRRVSRGMMNDVQAIAAYAPYVDAMFVDNECAALLAEQPLAVDLNYKAKIFSLSTGDAFLGYLDELAARASPEVVEQAGRIYGVT